MNEEEEKDETVQDVLEEPSREMAHWPLTASANLVWETDPKGQYWVSVVDGDGVPRWRYTYGAYLTMAKEAQKRGLY